MTHALLVIDVQNEYFAGANGAFPQENADETAAKIAEHIRRVQDKQLVIGVQHFTPAGAPLFARGSHGAALHESVAGLLADKPLVEKEHADSFLNTGLNEILAKHGVTHIDICGIMTQNCVTHTALSPDTAPYHVRVLSDLCTAPTALIHALALNALRDRSSEQFEVV
ncbi:isochorismatase family protein [Neisseria dentiae]|uniref:isochorismatase family protein n=1 Tax=Neisseria dentiae TaxID=194197 RepID=UPI0035A02657